MRNAPFYQTRTSGSQAHLAQPQPKLAAILRTWRWFTNLPPEWPKAPTSVDAIRLSDQWVKRLNRAPHGQTVAPINQRQLAKKLLNCGPGHRCESGACPKCSRAFQRWLVSQICRRTGGKK